MNRELIQTRDVRIENGPKRKHAVATKELLSDMKTAVHYKPGRYDAKGNPIIEGREMDYLDYRGEWVWYVYKEQEVMIDAHGHITTDPKQSYSTVKKWVPIGEFADKDAAVRFARSKRRGFFKR